MSDAANELIHAFTALSPVERHAVLIELARISESDSGSISDEELSRAGEQVFAIYDAEESDRGETNAG